MCFFTCVCGIYGYMVYSIFLLLKNICAFTHLWPYISLYVVRVHLLTIFSLGFRLQIDKLYSNIILKYPPNEA